MFGDQEAIGTEAILEALWKLEESPWGELGKPPKPLNARGLAQRLRQYDVKSRNVRIGEAVVKGYYRDDLYDSWQRYLKRCSGSLDETSRGGAAAAAEEPVGASPHESATSATSATRTSSTPTTTPPANAATNPAPS